MIAVITWYIRVPVRGVLEEVMHSGTQLRDERKLLGIGHGAPFQREQWIVGIFDFPLTMMVMIMSQLH